MPLLTIDAVGLVALRARIAAAQYFLTTGVYEAVTEAVLETAQALSAAAPVGAGMTGGNPPGNDADVRLSASFEPEVTGGPGTPTASGNVHTLTPTKLLFVRYGTGIYGPTGQRIYPRQASALSWIDPMTGLRITRKSVAGIKPNDFVTPVIEDAKAAAFVKIMSLQTDIVAILLA